MALSFQQRTVDDTAGWWSELAQVASKGRASLDEAVEEVCRKHMVCVQDAGHDSCEGTLPTTTRQCTYVAVRVRRGMYEISLDRLNSWLDGYQTASVLMTRRGWDDLLLVELDSGRTNEVQFCALEEFEYLFVCVYHRYTAPGTSSGLARLTLATKQLPDLAVSPTTGLRGSCSLTLALLRPCARALPSKRPPQLVDDLETVCLDSTERIAKVILACNNSTLVQTMAHWAVIFQFAENDLCICEETAVDVDGIRFGANDFVFRTVESSVEDYLARDGGPLRAHQQMVHKEIFVHTSKADLLHKCRTHPMNFTQYDINSNNCQRWARTLLVNGLGVDVNALPLRWGQVNASLAAGTGAVAPVLLTAALAPEFMPVAATLGIAALGVVTASGCMGRREQ